MSNGIAASKKRGEQLLALTAQLIPARTLKAASRAPAAARADADAAADANAARTRAEHSVAIGAADAAFRFLFKRHYGAVISLYLLV